MPGLGGGRPVEHCLPWGQCHRDHSYTALPRVLIDTSGELADRRPGGIFDIEILSRLTKKALNSKDNRGTGVNVNIFLSLTNV